ncbi:PREDICTED: dnaJ homolog subfamily C member 13-like, partial [Dipodomys ordii]|uniref:DnaJ homolog subfamily C member 13-like n=1 Tax=Dipodomys ordii TaxID=10020 RepID=A0A1S3GVQ0_DIPOR
EGDKEIATKMQELALSEGALPRHLHTAMFTISSDPRMLTHRQLSRHLVGLWTADNATATNLLKRILPPGLLAYLDSSDAVPEKDADRMHVRDNVKIAMVSTPSSMTHPHEITHTRSTLKITSASLL